MCYFKKKKSVRKIMKLETANRPKRIIEKLLHQHKIWAMSITYSRTSSLFVPPFWKYSKCQDPEGLYWLLALSWVSLKSSSHSCPLSTIFLSSFTLSRLKRHTPRVLALVFSTVKIGINHFKTQKVFIIQDRKYARPQAYLK